MNIQNYLLKNIDEHSSVDQFISIYKQTKNKRISLKILYIILMCSSERIKNSEQYGKIKNINEQHW